ncbi:MAG: STAS domain-containing protein [Candidatus Riflebacteria bacterium]|nr:STAS domain-containing protein [Candidatus Riflebacteria bacterium]
MSTYTITTEEDRGAAIIYVKGYFNAEASVEILAAADNFLRQDKVRLILDLEKTTVINSPGVAALMDLLIKVQTDYKGTLVLAGLDSRKSSLLTMAGVLSLIDSAKDREEAINMLAS